MVSETQQCGEDALFNWYSSYQFARENRDKILQCSYALRAWLSSVDALATNEKRRLIHKRVFRKIFVTR